MSEREPFLPGLEPVKKEQKPDSVFKFVPPDFSDKTREESGPREDCPECQTMGMAMGCSRHRRRAA